MRADGWNRIPLIRMTNVNLLPKPGMSLDEIVADTDDGLYLASNRSWSIDDRRLNFQFATEVAYEIKGGKKGRLFKNPTYTGITYEFWRSCDAVGDERSYVMLGTPNCGKGEPGQTGHVGHAVPGRPVPRRPGRGRQVVSRDAASARGRSPMIDDRAERRAGPRRGGARPRARRRRDRGRGARHGRRLGADPLRQQRDPPERRRDERRRSTCASSIGRRVGVASTDRTDDEGLRRLAESATAIARVVEELEDWGGLPGPTEIRDVAGRVQPGDRRREPGVPRRGGPRRHRRGRRRRGHGLRLVRDRHRDRSRSPIRTAPAQPGRGRRRSSSRSRWARTAGPATPRRPRSTPRPSTRPRSAARPPSKARATANAVAIEPGDYPVVLEEYAVVDLLDMLGYLGFSALAVQEERSFVEPGKRIGSDLVTIVDDGYDPAGLPLSFDFEGVAKQRVPLVEAGVCRDVVYDAQTAARDGVRVDRPRPARPRTRGARSRSTWSWRPGTTSREELIGGLDRGLLVTRFHYTNPVHPKLAIVTGMTRDGTFLVEGGKIVGAGPEPALHAELPRRAGRDVGGRRASARRSRGSSAGCVVPAVRIDGWTFTGTTEH